MLPWILAGFTGLSALTAAAALWRLGTQKNIDEETLKQMRRQAQLEEEARDRKRREEDDQRDRKRRDDDEARGAVLRQELAALTKRSNDRFQQWQDTVADLDDLWATVEDELLPWIRDAYRKLRESNIDIRQPPTIRSRRARHARHEQRTQT